MLRGAGGEDCVRVCEAVMCAGYGGTHVHMYICMSAALALGSCPVTHVLIAFFHFSVK